MRGGPRSGAGRPKGSRNRRSLATAEELALPPAKTPLSYLLTIMNDPTASEERRDRMALAAAPYFHSKLSPIGCLPSRGLFGAADDDEDDEDLTKAERLVAKLTKEVRQ